MSSPLLEIRNLSTKFTTEAGDVVAVNDIGFSINRSETIGIVGESGSGKSVTALSIMRLLSNNGSITAGKIDFFGRDKQAVDLLQISERELENFRGNEISMIFQEPMTSLNPVISCGKQVAEALIIHKNLSRSEAKQRTIQLFEKVKLPRAEKIFDAYPHELSGGQKQRVMIAMAISCDPAILIADEPTTALDVTVQKKILELLQQLKSEYNMSMIFISHDLAVISEIADRIVVMYKGKIVESGTTAEILSDPKHAYTKALLACR